jgi:hypothetical protein
LLPSWLPTNVESPDANAVSVTIVVGDDRIAQKPERKRGLAVLLIWLILLISCTVALLTQSDTPEVIEAQQFLLRDSSGKVRAGLVLEHNEPTLFFADTSGKRISEYK